MGFRFGHSVAAACVTLVLAPRAAMADASASPGDTDWALPGVVRVGVAGASEKRLSLAGTVGYGYLESQGSGDGAHQRISGSAALALTPLTNLSLALRFDERYDMHPNDGMGSHGAAVGDPRLLVRAGTTAGSFRLGAEVGAWLVGATAPSIDFSATTLDARLLGAFRGASGLTVGALAGFRLDNSGHAIEHPERLRFGDRLVLGLSDFDAVLAGLGVIVPAGSTEVFGEVSADVLVGSGAPGISKSPLRADLGVRHPLSRAFALEVRAEAALSGRPDVTGTAPLVPIEPRVGVFAGLRYTLPFQRPVEPAAPVAAPTPATAPVVAKPVAPATAELVVHVTAEDGSAIPDAKVTIRQGDWSHEAAIGPDGSYHAEGVPAGTATIAVEADGFAAAEQQAPVGGASAAPVEVRLVRTTPSGQIRGLVRSFGGKGLAASIHVDPIDKDTKTDADGAFTIDVPPGDYQVVVRAPHYKEQTRKIHVGENGVTVLNAELFEAK